MRTPAEWPLEAEEPLLDCKVFRVERTTARSPRTGRTHGFVRLRAPDWVNVIPLTADDDVVMVRLFRHGVREVTLEIPGGMVDPGESPAEAALREMREESGYAAPSAALLGAVQPRLTPDTEAGLFPSRSAPTAVTSTAAPRSSRPVE